MLPIPILSLSVVFVFLRAIGRRGRQQRRRRLELATQLIPIGTILDNSLANLVTALQIHGSRRRLVVAAISIAGSALKTKQLNSGQRQIQNKNTKIIKEISYRDIYLRILWLGLAVGGHGPHGLAGAQRQIRQRARTLHHARPRYRPALLGRRRHVARVTHRRRAVVDHRRRAHHRRQAYYRRRRDHRRHCFRHRRRQGRGRGAVAACVDGAGDQTVRTDDFGCERHLELQLHLVAAAKARRN